VADLSWAIEFDWDNDDSFAHDESAYVKYLWIDRGREGPFGDMLTGKMVLTLENESERFDPWNAGSAIYDDVQPGRKVKIKCTYSGSDYELFYGKIQDIEPIGKLGYKQVSITAYDGWADLIGSEASIALQSSQTTDTLIGLVLDEVNWPAGASRNLDVGSDTLTTWWCEQAASQAIRDLVTSEAGMFFFTVDGKARFINRANYNTAASADTLAQTALTDIWIYNPWEWLYNKVTVIANPIETTVGAELWRLQDATVLIQPGQSQIIWAQFHDTNDNPCAADNVVAQT
jgi:hypothetical protein